MSEGQVQEVEQILERAFVVNPNFASVRGESSRIQ
jgi:hypothetical protein